METFYSNSNTVLIYLSKALGKHTTYWLAHSCFRQFGTYLEVNGQSYSKASAQEWLCQQDRPKPTIQIYAKHSDSWKMSIRQVM